MGCYPCAFLDFNCSSIDQSWSKEIDLCKEKQSEIAKKHLKKEYNEKIDTHILNKCIMQDGKYKYEKDKSINYPML